MSEIDDFQGAIDNAMNSAVCIKSYDAAWNWAQDRIEALEAPYKMTDTPPSEPGWYVVQFEYNRHDVALYRDELDFKEALIEQGCGWKWGSAPLPIPTKAVEGE